MNPTETNNQSEQANQPSPQANSHQQTTDPTYKNEGSKIFPAENVNTPGIVILQWLTYAFWGWTALALTWLTGSVMYTLVADSDTGSFIVYALASVLVLLPVSFICDKIYSQNEPSRKTGAATIVMVIHAVIFALFSIGMLVSSVFAIVSLLTSESDSGGTQAALYTTLIMGIVYAALFIRTLNPPQFPFVRKIFWIFIVSLIGMMVLVSILGPISKERSLRNDKLIENNLSYVVNGISDYSSDNNKLPEDLSSIYIDGDAKKLIDLNLVKYNPEEKTTKASPNSLQNTNDLTTNNYSREVFYYSLCVNYDKDKKSSYRSYSRKDSDGYTDYIDVYEHPAGQVCYKLKTPDY